MAPPAGQPPPVAPFTDCSAAATSTTLPSYIIYPGLWPSFFFEARREIVSQGPAPVLMAAATLRETEAKAAADRFAEKPGTKMTAANRTVAFRSAEVSSSAKFEQRAADGAALLRSQVVDAEREAAKAAPCIRWKPERKRSP